MKRHLIIHISKELCMLHYALCIICCVSCVNEEGLLKDGDTPTGSFSCLLNATEPQISVHTRATLSDEEAANYTVTLTQNNNILVGPKKYNLFTESEHHQKVGSYYKLSAESCTLDEAETGYGVARYIGTSETFEIKKNENTEVTIPCTITNAGLCVVFDDSFTRLFTTYTVKTDDMRGLEFTQENASSYNNKGEFVPGQVAYYNVGNNGGKNVDVQINALGDKGKGQTRTTVTLKRGYIKRLTVNSTPSPDETGTIGGLTITIDEEFKPVNEEITIDPESNE